MAAAPIHNMAMFILSVTVRHSDEQGHLTINSLARSWQPLQIPSPIHLSFLNNLFNSSFCAKRRYYSKSNVALNSGYNNQSWVTLVDFISHVACNSHCFCAQHHYYSESNVAINSGY